MSNSNLTYTRLAARNVSFQLLRTNPKLTSNVKLTVDSTGSLWLNSINANEQLANQRYKRFAINEDSSHEVNLYRFYDKGKTPSSVAYELGSTIGKTASAKDLKDQYDFDLYTSGAKYLKSRQYSEKFSYFAPIYLDQVAPTKFVIFKIPGASNYTAGEGKDLFQTITVQDFATDLFKNATLVKTFDLGPTSKIGKYLQKITTNPMFTKNPLYVNYKTDGYSLYRGASIKTGTYVELPEQLSSVFSRSLPLLKVEQFVTQGFERNSIVHPKILNLEFLFDDETSDPCTFNRYFGFYCNDVDLEEFEIDLKAMFESRIGTASTPDLVSGISASQINGKVITIAQDTLSDKIYIGGTFTTYNGHTANRIARINADGTYDHSFVIDAGFDDQVNTIKVDRYGDVFVGGNFTTYKGLSAQKFVKLSPTGTVMSADAGFDDSVYDIEVSDNDELLIGGKFSQYTVNSTPTTSPGFIKLNLDLSLVSGFTVGSGFSGGSELVKSLTHTPTGKIILVGDFNQYQSTTAPGIVQLNQDGTVDIDFDYGTGFDSTTLVNKVIVEPTTGNAYVVGGFTQYNGVSVSGIVRLTPTGELDETFAYSTGANSSVTEIARDFDDKIYIGGQFTAYKGVPAKGLARLTLNGELDYSFDTSTGLDIQDVEDILIDEVGVYVAGGFTKFQEQTVDGLMNLSTIGLDNDQYLPIEFKQSDDVSFTLTNPEGVKLRAMNLTQDLSDLAKNRTDRENLFFPYLKDKAGQLHLINSQDWTQLGNIAEFKIDSTSFDLGLAFGPTELVVQETAAYSVADTKSTVSVTFTEKPNHLDTLRIYHPSGSRVDPNDPNGRFDDIIFTRNYLALNDQYSLAYSGGQSFIYVNGDSTLDLVCQAIVDIIDQFIDTSISGVNMNPTVFIQTNKFGDAYGELKVRFIPAVSGQVLVLLNNQVTLDPIYADGGFVGKIHAIIDSGNIDKLTPLIDTCVVKTTKNWSKISRICHASDSVVAGLSEADQAKAVAEYNSKATIQLVDDEEVSIAYDKIEIRSLFKPKVGVLSIFEMMDFDFTTFSTTYSRNLGLDLYKDFYLPAGVKILDFTKYTYQIIGDGTIVVNGLEYTPDDVNSVGERLLVWQDTQETSSYTIKSGQAILVYGKKLPKTTLDPSDSTFPDRLDIPYYDETGDATDYVGPFSIKADHAVLDQAIPTYAFREKYVSGNVASEYHVNLENFTSEFATEGRVVPYITKWGAIDSSDSRDNPYRMNSDILFGKDNFGPSHRETSPTPEKMTHEWFYLETDFGFTKDPSLARSNYYYFESPLDVTQLTQSDTYFDEYFTYVPKVNGRQVGRPQYRYSILNKNQFTRQYETLFKGSLFRFYELSQSQTSLADTNRFEDYKFTAIVKPVKENPTVVRQPVKYRVIENTDSKSITVVAELAIGHKAQIANSVFVNGWLPAYDDTITQETLFANSFKAQPVSYKIDAYIDCTSYSEYTDRINSTLPIPGSAGQTICVVYGMYSTVFATEGSAVYDAVLQNQIANGDKLAERTYVQVDKSWIVNLTTGTYPGVRIQAQKQDAWTYQTGSPASGEITSDTSGFNAMTNQIYINAISAASNPPTTVIPFDDAGSIDNTLDFYAYFVNNVDPNTITITHINPTTGATQEVSYQVFGTNAPAPGSSVYEIIVNPPSGTVITAPLTVGDVMLMEYSCGIPINDSSFTVEHRSGYFESIFGDYRIEFNQAEVSNLTYSFMYYAKDKKYNTKKTAYSTIQLSRGVDLSPSGIYFDAGSTVPAYIKTEKLVGLETYDSLADSEVAQISNYFAPIYIISPGEVDILVQVTDTNITTASLSDPTQTLDGIDGARLDLLLVSNTLSSVLRTVTPIPVALGDSVTYVYSPQAVPASTTAAWITDTSHFQIFGGLKYFEKVFENLSFAKFAQLLDKSQSVISWESYTNGILNTNKTISMEVIAADEIEKYTYVKITPSQVQTGQINQVAGYELAEAYSEAYSLSRYSGEYEAITTPVSGFKYEFKIGQNTLTGANICLNPAIDNFFIIPEFEYIKYSKTTILDLENSQRYSSVYPLIDESPIARTNFNMLASSWDYGYHFEYSTKANFTRVPGTRRVVEDYSFVSKLLNLPIQFIVEEFTTVELTNEQFTVSLANEANLVYSIFAGEIRFKLNWSDLITKYLSSAGLKTEFEKFFKYANGTSIAADPEFLGELTFDAYLSAYCAENIVQLYAIDSFEFYELEDRTITNNGIVFNTVEYDRLSDLGYILNRNVRINNTKNTVIEGSILIKPNTGVKMVPKLKIKFI